MPREGEPPPDQFQTTRWSLVLRARSDVTEEAGRALNELCAAYWYPVYAYLRRTSASAEDAEDLTQAYFANLLRRGYLDRADRDKGRLRAFILADLKFFRSNENARQRSAKRGGGRVIESLDQALAEKRYHVEPLDRNSPDQLFDRAWATTLLTRVREELRRQFAARGQERLFEVLQQFLAWNAGEQSYAEAAEALGRSVSDIKVSVHRMRKRFRALLEAEVANTVAFKDDVAEEIRSLASLFG